MAVFGKASVAGDVNFTFSKFSGFAAAAVWTLGWVRIVVLTEQHLAAINSLGAAASATVALTGFFAGCWGLFRFYPRRPELHTHKPSPPEPWYRRATGWFGATVWCAAAAVWNMAIYSVLVQSAIKGQTANFFILIPFAVVGFFLLLFLFVSIGIVLDFVFQLEKDSTPSMPDDPAKPVEVIKPEQPAPSPAESSKPVSPNPIVAFLLFGAFINWFLFFGVSMHLGGDAVGILPSQDGFVVKSHGNHTAVSESVWVFSLFYSTATLLGTPAIWIPFGVWQACRSKRRIFTSPLAWFVGLFLAVWIAGWYGSIGSSFYRSYHDWQKLKHSSPAQKQNEPNGRT